MQAALRLRTSIKTLRAVDGGDGDRGDGEVFFTGSGPDADYADDVAVDNNQQAAE